MVVSVVIPSSSINSTQVLESCIKIILQKIHYQRPLLKLNHIFLINLAVVKGGLQTVLSLDVLCPASNDLGYFYSLFCLVNSSWYAVLGRSANKPKLKVYQYLSFSQLSEKHCFYCSIILNAR